MALRFYISIDPIDTLAGSAVETVAARQNLAIEVVRTGRAGFGSSRLTHFPKDFGAPPRSQAAE